MTEKEFIQHCEALVKTYKGDVTVLEHAIGCFVVGRKVGWKCLLVMHDRKSIKRYEDILGLPFKDHLPEVGDLAHRSKAWKIVQGVSSFWKAVKGEIPNVKSTEMK